MKKILRAVKNFFYPAPGSPRWMFVLPILALVFLGILSLGLGVHGWEYSNSPQFCGTACHTMPPQDTVYKISPHANVTCEECHIGRVPLVEQFVRKQQGLKELYYTVFNLYEFPIRASALQPARDTCEKCHQPEAFSGDSLRTITRFANDYENTRTTLYLILKTGGGSKRENLGRGIHWHIVNRVSYYATDPLDQNIPFMRVYNDDGSTTDYVDIESGFDPSTLDESQLKELDCITCHNRVTHEFKYPYDSVDESMARGLIDPAIPGIRKLAVDLLTTPYASHDQAIGAIDALAEYYQGTDFYAGNEATVAQAIEEIKAIYERTVFHDQGVSWDTHPNNIGHIDSPGCFRCHDGKHLNDKLEAVRLECNVCHSIPVVASEEDFVTSIEISRGLEPESHRNPNWISLHNRVFLIDTTCSNCHSTEDPGGVTNTSFCSNSACHGSAFTFAGFDAPKLREVLSAQLPTPAPEPTAAPVVGVPTYDANVGALFITKCATCHGANGSAGLNVATYADLLKGGNSGASVIPGNSKDSKLIQVQSGAHFAKFSAEQLALIIQWIDAGAPEK